MGVAERGTAGAPREGSGEVPGLGTGEQAGDSISFSSLWLKAPPSHSLAQLGQGLGEAGSWPLRGAEP